MSISIKSGGTPPTSIRGIRPEMAIAHTIVAAVFAEFGVDCVITSGTDAKHKNGSKHYTGDALDYRIRVFEDKLKSTTPPDQIDQRYKAVIEQVCEQIQERLGDEFDVINEFYRLHIHVEFDPTRPLNEGM